MNHSDIEELAIIYGNKELIIEFLENLEIAKRHDDAPINAILLKGDMKKEVKKFVWKSKNL